MIKKQATIRDIAKALNTTASTVSRALNDHPKISRSTKELVWDTAKKLNYQPNTLASSLRKGKAYTVGLIVPRINRHFFSNVITGVESVLNPAGYNLIMCQSEENIKKETENIKTLVASRVDGIIISISLETNSITHLQKVVNNNIPLVMFDRVSDQMNVSKVENDDESGSYDLTNHLLDQGCKTIMWMGGPRSSNISRNLFSGYTKSLKNSNIDPDKQLFFESSPTLLDAYGHTQKMIAQNTIPDAIFAASDYMAMGVIKALQESGLKVPQDVAVAGYSNEPFAALISPSLTTVEQYSEEIGKTAARLLLDEIESGLEFSVPRKTVLTPKLLIRESTLKHNTNDCINH
jgi:LacI family transcriptional regulator